jgi:NAD+-dependent protein deacetylase sirtuin 5
MRIVSLSYVGRDSLLHRAFPYYPRFSISDSGLQTFRGAGGWWRKQEATKLATPQSFQRDPSLVWQFYAYRRHKALLAKPNPAHLALAEYTRQNPGRVFTITQNVDGLSARAGHPESNIVTVHGDLWTLRCWRTKCGYSEKNLDDPVVPALLVRDDFPDGENVPKIPEEELPHCPKCTALLRPGVVFFNEQLPGNTPSLSKIY